MKKVLMLTALVTSIFAITMCKAQTSKEIKYIYADGNNNTYVIKPDGIKYNPITPEQSSSGTYSGGEPKEVKLTKEEFEKLSSVFTEKIEAKSQIIERRVKMSGMLTVVNGKESVSYIFGARSKSKADIEKMLKRLISKN